MRLGTSHAKKSVSGFTLVETLLAVLLLSLLTAAAAAGVTAARDVYNRIRRTADAQILCSTAINAITADLESGTDFIYDTTLTFTSGSRNYRMYYQNGSGNTNAGSSDSNSGIQVYNTSNSTSVPLLTDQTESLDLYTEITFTIDNVQSADAIPNHLDRGYIWFKVLVKDSEGNIRDEETACVKLLAA